MRAKFLADADFNHKIVLGIRRREPSLDFRGAHDGNVVGVPDPEVLNIAAESGRILVRTIEKRCLLISNGSGNAIPVPGS